MAECRLALEERKLDQTERLPVLTTGEKARDTAFAKELEDFNLSDVDKGLELLGEALQALESSDDLTGGVIGAMPKFFKDRVLPEASAIQ